MRSYVSFVLLLLGLAFVPSTLAQPTCFGGEFGDRFYCKAFADRPFFNPGDTGKLTIDLKNLNSYSITINNLSIAFPWAAYISGRWDGNSTISVNANLSSNAWMQEQTLSFTVPSDGGFVSGLFGSSGSVGVHYTSYCPSCGSGQSGSINIEFTIIPNSFLISTGWQAMSNYLLITDILLAALVALFLIHVLRSRRNVSALPPMTPSGPSS